jgi:hypothetical protein
VNRHGTGVINQSNVESGLAAARLTWRELDFAPGQAQHAHRGLPYSRSEDIHEASHQELHGLRRHDATIRDDRAISSLLAVENGTDAAILG